MAKNQKSQKTAKRKDESAQPPDLEINRGGRPPALQPNDQLLKFVRGLGAIMATSKECAAALEVSEPTWIAFKKKHPEVEQAFEQGQGKRKISLRRAQFKTAEAGNATMQIWLGKQYLGQRDHKDIGGPNGGPIPVFDLSRLGDMTDEELDILERALIKLGIADPDQGGKAEAPGEPEDRGGD